MLRAVTLLSKTFLHHLSGLLTLLSFHLLWLRALELLESFMRAPSSEMLAEAVPETLKNMLLVIGTSGAFEHKIKLGGTQQDLCQLTAAVVAAMCPQLTSSPDLNWLWGVQQDGAAPDPHTPQDAVAAAPDGAAGAVANGQVPSVVG
jgi:brefeldin A-resistance guanine nucleotide exchange factor 1